MPEFYIMFAWKKFSGFFWGDNPLLPRLLRQWLDPRPPPAKSGPAYLSPSIYAHFDLDSIK